MEIITQYAGGRQLVKEPRTATFYKILEVKPSS
jgi:hypothetical protein